LLQVTMGHASILVTAHTYADLYDDDLDRVAAALDRLGDMSPNPDAGYSPDNPVKAGSESDLGDSEKPT